MSKKLTLVTLIVSAVLAVLVLVYLLTRGNSRQILPESDLSNHPLYGSCDFGDEGIIDIGTQPVYLPTGVITELMKRDRILHTALSEIGMEMRFHAFLKGADVNFFIERGDLEAGIGGDMPALSAAAESHVLITTVVQQGFTSIVSRKNMTIEGLKGKRIGYAFGSNAHYALLQALDSGGIRENDVHLVPYEVNEMPDALDRGEIDAFSAWKPTPAEAKLQFSDQIAIHRSFASGYLYFSRSFAEQHLGSIYHIVASQLRAIRWLRRNEQNLLEACRLVLQEQYALTGKQALLSPQGYAKVVESDLMETEMISAFTEEDLDPGGRLFTEFEFLKRIGKIRSTVDWQEVRGCFDPEIFERVFSNWKQYRLDAVEYAIEKDAVHATR